MCVVSGHAFAFPHGQSAGHAASAMISSSLLNGMFLAASAPPRFSSSAKIRAITSAAFTGSDMVCLSG